MSRKFEPKLRFPEFKKDGSWLKKPMGELFDFQSNNSLSRDKLNYDSGIVKNIHYGDIHTKFKTLFKIKDELLPYINKSESLDRVKSESYCVEGDIVFADASEDLEDIGKSIELVDLNNEKVLSGLHTILARPKENTFAKGFNGYLFKSPPMRTQIQKEAQGAKVLGISGKKMSKMDLFFPKNKNEQQKITDCLSSLDDLITAQNDTVEALKNYKNGLLQQLFPQEGEVVPRLRFSEFKKSGDWKKTTLSELAVVVTQKNRNFSVERVLTNSAANGVVDQRDFFDKDIANKDNLDGYYIIDFGDFVYNPRISNLAPVGPISRNNIGKGIMSPLYTIFHFNNEPTDFFEHYFKSNHWHPYLRSVANTGARHDRMAITNSILMNMPILLPKPEEQQKIAECLSCFDKLVNSEEEILKQLKNHKKGLLQQLFPSIEDGNSV